MLYVEVYPRDFRPITRLVFNADLSGVALYFSPTENVHEGGAQVGLLYRLMQGGFLGPVRLLGKGLVLLEGHLPGLVRNDVPVTRREALGKAS